MTDTWKPPQCLTGKSQRLVPVFYSNQDETWEPAMDLVSRADVRLLKANGRGWFINHGAAFRLFEATPMRYFAVAARPGIFERSSTISLSDMLANAGITGNDPGDVESVALAGVVRRAQEKVIWYPYVGDDQAVLARGRWHNAPLAPKLARVPTLYANELSDILFRARQAIVQVQWGALIGARLDRGVRAAREASYAAAFAQEAWS